MQLEKVNGLGGQIAQAAFEKGGQIFAVVGGGFLAFEAAAGLGGDVERLAALLAEAGEEPFAVESLSSTVPQALPMAQAPKLTAEIFQPVLPSSRYSIEL